MGIVGKVRNLCILKPEIILKPSYKLQLLKDCRVGCLQGLENLPEGYVFNAYSDRYQTEDPIDQPRDHESGEDSPQ